MDWTRIHFGKYRGKNLPEIIFEDADYFFFLYENYFFHGDLEKEANYLYPRARSIKVPSKNGKKMLIKYFFNRNEKSRRVKFYKMKLIPDGSDRGRSNVSSWIDFYLPRSPSNFDKTGYENFVMGLKSILFNNPVLRMYSHNWQEFFDDEDNFDLRRVRDVQL
jgi:hypothetical protein